MRIRLPIAFVVTLTVVCLGLCMQQVATSENVIAPISPEDTPLPYSNVLEPAPTDFQQLRSVEATPSTAPPARKRKRARILIEEVHEPIPSAEVAKAEEIATVRQRLNSTRDAVEREELGESLRTLLGFVFDSDLSRREKDVEELEAQVAKIRAEFDRRRSMRDRIIEVQIETALLQSEGLLFPSLAATNSNFIDGLPMSAKRYTDWEIVRTTKDGNRIVSVKYSFMAAKNYNVSQTKQVAVPVVSQDGSTRSVTRVKHFTVPKVVHQAEHEEAMVTVPFGEPIDAYLAAQGFHHVSDNTLSASGSMSSHSATPWQPLEGQQYISQ